MSTDFNKKMIAVMVIAVVLAFGAGFVVKGFIGGGDSVQSHDQHADGESIWTCSMHPQIRQKKPGMCPLCDMALIELKEGSS